MKNRKQRIEDEMGSFFGFPKGCYTEVLGELARTKVNSCRTSSIPLAEFWQPENLGKIKALLGGTIPGFRPEASLKYLEFPTEAVFNGRKIGRPSMTDIMILDPGLQIAIEGKMTEYVRYKEKTIREWLEEPSRGVDVKPRLDVLKAWIGYIHEADCTGVANYGEFFRDCKDVAYQFLHRTASACNKAGIKKGEMPVLVYQLFFDANDKAHVAKMEEFKADLRRWASLLKLRNMKFIILAVPVTNLAEVDAQYGSMRGELFELMRDETIYKFDFDGITVETVIDAKMPDSKEER
jgi:hypothetical protein